MALLHTTSILNLGNILTSGTIKPYYPDEKHISTKGIYTVYVFKDMVYEGKYWYYNSHIPSKHQIIIVLKPEILKKYKFIASPAISYGWCGHHPEYCIITSETIMKQSYTQSIKKLETYINKTLNAIDTAKKINHWDNFTHEVVLQESVNIKDIETIIVAPSMVRKVSEYIAKLKELKKIPNDLNIHIIRRPKETQWKTIFLQM